MTHQSFNPIHPEPPHTPLWQRLIPSFLREWNTLTTAATAVIMVFMIMAAQQIITHQPTLPSDWRDFDVPTGDKNDIQNRDDYLASGLTSGTNARNAYVARNHPRALVSFTIQHPHGWTIEESWPWDGPQGWISAPRPEGETSIPTLRIWSDEHYLPFLEQVENDERYEVTKLNIAGAEATLVIPADDHKGILDRIGIYYETIPGTPKDSEPLPLAITGLNRGFDLEILPAILTSVWYYELPPLPKLPVQNVFPTADWVRVDARDDIENGFSVNLPPGWQVEQSKGIDTLIGKFTGDGIEITYDFGTAATVAYNPEQFFTGSPPQTYHRIWEEEIDDATFWFVQPVSKATDPEAITAVFTPASGTISRNAKGLNIYSIGLTPEQQDLALAIFRTIQFD